MRLSGAARIAGIVGWPIAHSRSPALHGFWLETHGIDGAYVPMAVRPEHLAQALRALPALGFAGCNLTLPHKEAALAVLDRVDVSAREIGAVNTIVVARDGSVEGRNTDAFGFIENLRSTVPACALAGKTAVVLGAGGGARAVVAALLAEDVGEIRLVNRSRARAETLEATFGKRLCIVDWRERSEALAGTALLVNATSLGMTGAPPLDLTLDRLPASAVVNDIVYVPLETALLREARRRGNPIVDGLGMLLHQGRPGFAAWFGVMPEVTAALRAALLRTFEP